MLYTVEHVLIRIGALHVGDEIVEICGISVQGRTVDFLQKMLVSVFNLLEPCMHVCVPDGNVCILM